MCDCKKHWDTEMECTCTCDHQIDYAQSIKNSIEDKTSHHPPTTPKVTAAHETIRAEFREIMLLVERLVPESEEQEESLKRLQEAMMWANAGIAIWMNKTGEN